MTWQDLTNDDIAANSDIRCVFFNDLEERKRQLEAQYLPFGVMVPEYEVVAYNFWGCEVVAYNVGDKEIPQDANESARKLAEAK